MLGSNSSADLHFDRLFAPGLLPGVSFWGAEEKMMDDPTKRPMAMHLSPRCTATSKRTKVRCKGPAVRGWNVCRFHGARGGGPKGHNNGNYRHGEYTKEAADTRRVIVELVRTSQRMID